jgi:hypothetical protein
VGFEAVPALSFICFANSVTSTYEGFLYHLAHSGYSKGMLKGSEGLAYRRRLSWLQRQVEEAKHWEGEPNLYLTRQRFGIREERTTVSRPSTACPHPSQTVHLIALMFSASPGRKQPTRGHRRLALIVFCTGHVRRRLLHQQVDSLGSPLLFPIQ